MKKLFIASIMGFALIILVGTRTDVVANGALVARDNLCVVPDSLGNLVVIEDSHSTVTTNEFGTTVLTCKGKLSDNPDQKGAVRWNAETLGLPCGTPGGLTNQWHAVVTPNGNVTLVCLVNPSMN